MNEELPDPFDPAHREVPTIEELERELEVHVPEAAARIVNEDPSKIALNSLRHLDYKTRRAYELYIGLTGKILPMGFSEIAENMAISYDNARKLVKRAEMNLGGKTQILEKLAEDRQKQRTIATVDLQKAATELTNQEFEMLEMMEEGRSMAEIGNELGIGGLHGARELERELAAKMGIKPEALEDIAPKLVQLAIESWQRDK